MATVTLHPFGSGPTRNRAIAPTASPNEPTPRLPAFWGSLFNSSTPAAANDEAPRAVKSSAVVGDLWIQIR
jgi:hypothetical protein